MEHTPGPWKIAKWENKRVVDGFETVITDSRGHGIVTFNQKGQSKKVTANAHLIKAAPNMLEALEDLISAGAAVHHYLGQATGKIHADALQKARAAIAKTKSD
jgi:hypothetical protein